MSSYDSTEQVLEQLTEVEPIKKGGQKEVFCAKHPEWGKCVLKVGKSNSPSALERAKREISVQGLLGTAYYPKIYYFTVQENGYYIIEEFIESVSLGELISNYENPYEVLDLIKNIIEALSPLWQMGIAHRDVKPDNILITTDGKPKIIDLGILRDPREDSLTLTVAPLGPCTPAYAAPEQLMNKKSLIGPRTDQFAIGIIAFQLLAKGIHPFDPSYLGKGESIPGNIVDNCWSDKTLKDRDLGGKIINFIEKCMGYYPYQRYRNYEKIITALHLCMGGRNGA